jgi:hypothetical protein
LSFAEGAAAAGVVEVHEQVAGLLGQLVAALRAADDVATGQRRGQVGRLPRGAGAARRDGEDAHAVGGWRPLAVAGGCAAPVAGIAGGRPSRPLSRTAAPLVDDERWGCLPLSY